MNCKVELTEINLLGFWNFNLKNTDCAICRNVLTCSSISNEENNAKSFIVEGTCGHAFHDDCIGNWLQNYLTCPLCSGEHWKYLEKENTTTGITLNGKPLN
jgi:RING-box protein 1